jgi:hypothetical protein
VKTLKEILGESLKTPYNLEWNSQGYHVGENGHRFVEEVLFLSEKNRSGLKMGTPENPHPAPEWKFFSLEDRKNNALHKLLSKESENHQLDEYKQDSISRYKNYSIGINKVLRNGHDPALFNKGQIIEDLDHVTSQKTKHSFTVYRGTYNDEWNATLPVGSLQKDIGFTGTSLNKHTALLRASGRTPPHVKNNELHWRTIAANIKPGTKGHYLDTDERDHSYKGEQEYLLHRGTTFKVTEHSYDKVNKIHTIHLDIHSQEDHSRNQVNNPDNASEFDGSKNVQR